LARLNGLVNLGAIAFARHDFATAAQTFNEGLQIANRACWPREIAMCQNNLGQALLGAGQAHKGIEQLMAARRLATDLDLADIHSDASRALADGMFDQDRPKALRYANEAVRAARTAGSVPLELAARLTALKVDGDKSQHLAAAARLLRENGEDSRADALLQEYSSSCKM
ncbi:MAG: hypothetical protein HN348_19950, partial [Proteobacteria bacterium]|nr:hypothetical protein [Pseudomonadota bacterium]